jgi:hypothetical protein
VRKESSGSSTAKNAIGNAHVDEDYSDEDVGDASKSASGVRSLSAGTDASCADKDEVRSARDSDDESGT